MGIYINPQGMSKQEFLRRNGFKIPNPMWPVTPVGKLQVCCIDNGLFEAVGVAYSENETKAFAYPDGRGRTWWLLDKEVVLKSGALLPSDVAFLEKQP